MPNWKKVIVSGSNASLNSITASSGATITGSVNISGSTTQIGSNNLFGNTALSGSIIISGALGTNTPTVRIYGDTTHDGYIQFEPVSTNINQSISASYIYVSGSTNDLYFSQNGNGYNNTTRLRWIEGNLYTGLLNGGVITSQSSTVYQISSGSGIIVNLNASLNDNPYPVVQYLNWGNLSASIAPLTSSYQQAFVAIDSTGNIYQQGTPFSNGQFDTVINIGTVLFQNQSTINGVKTQPSVAYGFEQAQNTFNRAFGPLKLSGYTLAPSGSSTGSLIVGSGTAYSPGSNYIVDPNEPYYTTDSGTNVSKIFRYYQSGSSWVYLTNAGAGYQTIDPGLYSNNGTLTTVQPNDWSIQRVFWFPNSVAKAIVVYYGNASYSTETNAIANINIEPFVEAPNTAANAIYLGAIIIRGGGVLSTDADFTIVPGGLFRQVGGSGGGGSLITQTLSGLSDVSISGPTNLQPLVYSTTAAKWINSSNISGSLFGNAQTATTASYAIKASSADSATNASTASYVLQAVSASFATTASYSNKSSLADNATNASTASYVLNAVSASFATNANLLDNLDSTAFAQLASANTFTNNQVITGSLSVTNTAFIDGQLTVDNNIRITGPAGSSLLLPDGGVVSDFNTGNTRIEFYSGSMQIYANGSNEISVLSTGVRIGNTITDSHRITGSVNITGSVTLNGNQLITGSATIGAISAGASENTLTLGARDTANEGGQIGFNAPGGIYTSASFIDNWQNKARILKGNNTTSTGLIAQWDIHTTQMNLPGYTNASSFVGTATANLAVDSSGNVITVSTSGAPVFPYVGNAVITGSLTATTGLISPVNGGMYLRGGDDAELWDINISNHLGIYGQQDQTVASVKLGSGGGIISGKSGFIGINTINPSYALDINANTLTGARVYSGSLAVGNITPSATVGRIDASNDVVAFSTSDSRLKTNILPIENPLEKITQIGGYTFDWKSDPELVKLHGFEGHDIGVIAEEIEKVLPEVVTTRDSGYKAVKYEKIVPLLIEAIKELKAEVDSLKSGNYNKWD